MENIVFVLTKAKPFEKEEFVDVFFSVKALEKHLRTDVSQYLKKDGEGQYHVDDKDGTTLYFSHRAVVKK